MPLRNSLKKECYPSSIIPPSPSLTFIIGNQYLDRYSVSFEYSLSVQNSEDLKSVIASLISLLVHDLAMQRSFGNKSPFLCKHPFDWFTIHLSIEHPFDWFTIHHSIEHPFDWFTIHLPIEHPFDWFTIHFSQDCSR